MPTRLVMGMRTALLFLFLRGVSIQGIRFVGREYTGPRDIASERTREFGFETREESVLAETSRQAFRTRSV